MDSPVQRRLLTTSPELPASLRGQVRVGVDVVSVSRIQESLDAFGRAFLERNFSPGEIEYALQAPAVTAERLAARFAAKEAVIKALDLSEKGVSLKDICVAKLPSGACRIELQGSAAPHGARLGIDDIAVSLTHEGDCAAAIVIVIVRNA